MNKYEILAPVGSKENFKIAIRSGADAVYLGLPKFNARMKADNITLEDLPELVRYAHLKQVKVYITLNTLLTNNEIKECILLVKECMQANVDAFIVQDYGLIYVLKDVFPDIVLHGSTQLGVHNVRGARIAKTLGLSRVVLSREVTLKDIKAIKQSVDIELETFVQGAMCVAFSGNCYLSSIKCGASGNRGECKQLCRLPYTLTANISGNTKSAKTTQATGYMISPRDNCMLDYLRELVDIGVESFKIEGRLRNSNYLATATSVYRQALDCITHNKSFDEKYAKKELSKVFSRGEFVSGYFETNDIIESKQNSHLGEYIGKVISCTRFKDMYKITVQASRKLNTGDGLKFVGDNNTMSMGVGNIEYNGNNIVLFGKNYIEDDTKIYITYDSSRKYDVDLSKKARIKFKLIAKIDEPVKLEISWLENSNPDNQQNQSEDVIIKNTIIGDVCQLAKNRPITKEAIINQLQKVDKEMFDLIGIQVHLNGDIFLSLSTINELRRKAIDSLIPSIEISQCELPKIITVDTVFGRLAIVDEYALNKDLQGFDGLILSPTKYNVDTISKFKAKYDCFEFASPLIVNLPIIAMVDDLVVIDQIVDIFKSDCVFIANNIYALDYINSGATIWAGSGLNISNDFASSLLMTLGCEQVVSNIEKWCPTIKGSYKHVGGNATLMTFAHCPNKTLKVSSCNHCSACNNLTLNATSGSKYTIRRYTIANCYFELVDDRELTGKYSSEIVDLRN